MDESARRGRDVAERVDVRHHVVAKAPLVRGDDVEVDVVEMRAHLRDRLVRNRHAELLLRFGEREPELAPQAVSHRRRPELEHRLRRVPLGERRRVAIVSRHRTANSVTQQLPLSLDDDAEIGAAADRVDDARRVLRRLESALLLI